MAEDVAQDQPDDNYARRKEDAERCQKAAALLFEHFDSVQIFVTRYNSEARETMRYSCIEGNWYASFGIVKDYVLREDEKTRVGIRREAEDE